MMAERVFRRVDKTGFKHVQGVDSWACQVDELAAKIASDFGLSFDGQPWAIEMAEEIVEGEHAEY